MSEVHRCYHILTSDLSNIDSLAVVAPSIYSATLPGWLELYLRDETVRTKSVLYFFLIGRYCSLFLRYLSAESAPPLLHLVITVTT